MAMEVSRAYDQRTTVHNRQAATRPAMDYLFLSGVLALDLVNTEVVVRGKRYDLFATPEDVADWWQQGNASHHLERPTAGEDQMGSGSDQDIVYESGEAAAP